MKSICEKENDPLSTDPAATHPVSQPTVPRDDSRRAARRMRPSTIPAYYLGRPASFWLAHFRRGNSRGDGD